MADQRIGNRLGVPALNALNGTQRSNLNGSGNTYGELENDSFDDIASLKVTLATVMPAYYTATVLNKMTYNDLVYAVRRLSFPTSIKQ